eukprot:512558-Alexandrium_andersonii.AAC.1
MVGPALCVSLGGPPAFPRFLPLAPLPPRVFSRPRSWGGAPRPRGSPFWASRRVWSFARSQGALMRARNSMAFSRASRFKKLADATSPEWTLVRNT